MATKRNELLERLATARAAKRKALPQDDRKAPSKPLRAPRVPETTDPVDIITNPQRELAKEVTDMAMVMGWQKAVQEGAYKNIISEVEMKKVLDEAVKYQDKADPSGRIDGIDDWGVERRGRSQLKARAGF